jgi:hypothetical protein
VLAGPADYRGLVPSARSIAGALKPVTGSIYKYCFVSGWIIQATHTSHDNPEKTDLALILLLLYVPYFEKINYCRGFRGL